jgi:hypothetical protein
VAGAGPLLVIVRVYETRVSRVALAGAEIVIDVSAVEV